MPPKKKSKKSATPEANKKPVEPREYLSKAREKAVKVLIKSDDNKNVNYDIEQNIREIRAILATNKEILKRCMKYKRLSSNRGDCCDEIQFTRADFDTVKSITRNRYDNDGIRFSHGDSSSSSDDEDGKVTLLVAYPILSEESFDMTALTKPLPELERILSIQQMAKPDCNMFIDYSKLFENALLLQDDVLEPTLAMVKDRLMDIQVCLGEIDAWIMETKENIGFLEKTFGIDLTDFIHIVSSGEKKVLKKFIVSGKHEATFDIRKKHDQKRLTKFIDFLKMEDKE